MAIRFINNRENRWVAINPINIPEVPQSANAIFDRINTLSFNSSLMHEMRAIHFVTSLIESGELDSKRYKLTHIHTIDAEEEMSKLTISRAEKTMKVILSNE